MTLGGLALAVGILVDEATVTVENIHTHLSRREPPGLAAYDATAETVLPRLLAMLCVVAVFIPAFFMVGAARALFVPLALAVGFSMMASYLLSSTLVPVFSVWFLSRHADFKEQPLFARLQPAYRSLLQALLPASWVLLALYLVAAGCVVFFVGRHLGREIFPKVEAGELMVRLRAEPGTQLNRTEEITIRALGLIEREAGASNVLTSLGFVGVHASSYPINLIYQWNSGPEEAVLQVQFRREAGLKIDPLKDRLRNLFSTALPGVLVSFEPGDIISRVMSMGATTPVEVAVTGPNLTASREYAEQLRISLARIPELRDLQYGQSLDYPTVEVMMNRERAGLLGVRVSDLSRSLVAATSSSRYLVPNYWADPNSGVSYQIQVQVPQTNINSIEAIQNVPVSTRNGAGTLLRNVAAVAPGTAYGEYDRYNMQRMITLTANIAAADLGHVASSIQSALNKAGPPPPRVSVAVRGQIVPLQQLLGGLSRGLIVAILVVFLLLTANFQSLRLSLLVMLTIPAVVSGVVLALAVTGTTMNIQSFMGAIMAVGVAVANSILLVTFAERARRQGLSAREAALDGALSRLRPILMTSCAMIAGMLPLAAGLGDGGEQTAPLGRAVVGGLIAAGVATLFLLPLFFAAFQRGNLARSRSLSPYDPESVHYQPPSLSTP